MSNHETAWADIADLVEYMSSHPSFRRRDEMDDPGLTAVGNARR